MGVLNKPKDSYDLVCIPTGEVINANGIQMYGLYENDVIEYEPFGEFWFFDISDLDRVRLTCGVFKF